MVLQELSIQKGFSLPDYNIISQISGTHINRFDYVVTVCGIRASGSGPSKQLGKHQAAHNALLQLQELGIYEPSENPFLPFKAELQSASDSAYQKGLNCIGKSLLEACSSETLVFPLKYQINFQWIYRTCALNTRFPIRNLWKSQAWAHHTTRNSRTNVG